jgi:anti-sigma B factor antagonist
MTAAEVAICSRHTVLALDGEIDLVSAPDVRALLADIVNDHSTRAVVIDLAGVTFMDSSGVGALLSAYRPLKLQRRPLVVAQPQAIVARVLGITNIERLIPVMDSVSSAVDNCAEPHTSAT